MPSLDRNNATVAKAQFRESLMTVEAVAMINNSARQSLQTCRRSKSRPDKVKLAVSPPIVERR